MLNLILFKQKKATEKIYSTFLDTKRSKILNNKKSRQI